jgi:hypothetical protein
VFYIITTVLTNSLKLKAICSIQFVSLSVRVSCMGVESEWTFLEVGFEINRKTVPRGGFVKLA